MKLMNRWVILGILGIAFFLFFLAIFLLGSPVTQTEEVNLALAAITVLPGTTSTPLVSPTPTHDPALGTATPAAGIIALGAYVQIGGTDGEGLRIRSEPGLEGEYLFLGFDTELFQVLDGPQESDGYTWWYLLAPYDDTRSGWAVSDFLVPVTGED